MSNRRLIKVEGIPNLRRDSKTGAILAVNMKDLEKAKTKKLSDKEKDKRLAALEEKVQLLMSMIEDKL